MYKEFIVLIFEHFKFKILIVSEQKIASQEYIQGQLNEARHQLEILEKKLQME